MGMLTQLKLAAVFSHLQLLGLFRMWSKEIATVLRTCSLKKLTGSYMPQT